MTIRPLAERVLVRRATPWPERAPRTVIEQERLSAAQRRSAPPSSEPDPYEDAPIREFQRRHDLPADGQIGAETRRAIRWGRERHVSVDPADAESIRVFQREHRLEADGVLGPRTQAALGAVRKELEPSARGER